MKRMALVLCAAAALALCGCGQGSTDQAPSTPNAATASSDAAQTVEFKGVKLDIPSTWKEVDIDKGTIESAAYWQYAGDDDPNSHGAILAYSEPYDSFGNTDTQVPDPSDPVWKKTKEYTDLGLKALDARFFLEMIAKASLGGDGKTVDQSTFLLEDREGHAVWSCELVTQAGKLFAYSIPLEDRVVAFAAACTKDGLSAEQKSVIDSMTIDEDANALILEMAQKIEGYSQDDAVNIITDYVNAKASASSSDTGANASGTSSKKDSGTHESPTGEKWVERDDGVYQFSDDGSVTRYQGDNITTLYEDGKKEWTDGWGTVVRDEDGDGKPDYVSYDSGETWQRVKN